MTWITEKLKKYGENERLGRGLEGENTREREGGRDGESLAKPR